MAVPMNQMCERGVCMNLATVEVGNKRDPIYICSICDKKDKSVKIEMVLIHPHHCSREEYGELITYLKEKCWDYKTFKKEKGE